MSKRSVGRIRPFMAVARIVALVLVLLVASFALVSCAQETETMSEEGGAPAGSVESPTNQEVDLKAGMAVAAQMQDLVNTLVDYTTTTVIPGAGAEPGTYSFIALSEQAIFGVPEAKRGWLVVAVAAAGQVLRDHEDIAADQIIVSDSSLMGQREAFAIDADTAKSLQRRVSDGDITLEKMYADILAGLEEYEIPES